jgi:hypothetical protein
MKKWLFLLSFSVVFFLSCPNQADDPPVEQYNSEEDIRFPIPGDLMGMVHAGSRSDKVTEEYALLDELGVKWMLTDFSWGSIQPEKDRWNLDAFKTYADNGKAHGKKILAVMDYDADWIHEEGYADDPHHAGDECDGPHRYISPSEIPLFCDYVCIFRQNLNTKYGTLEHQNGNT